MWSAEQTFFIAAPPSIVWSVLTDVERWPGWTSSMRRVKHIYGGQLALDSRVRLWIAGSLLPTSWTVTAFEPLRAFTWQSRVMPGVVSIGDHELAPDVGGTRVTLRVTIAGPIARFVAPLLAHVSRRNLRLEGEGLTRASEASATR